MKCWWIRVDLKCCCISVCFECYLLSYYLDHWSLHGCLEITFNEVIPSPSTRNTIGCCRTTKRSLPNASTLTCSEETLIEEPKKVKTPTLLWLLALKIKPDAPPITLNSQSQWSKLLPTNTTLMLTTSSKPTVNFSRELEPNLRLLKLNIKLDKLPWEPTSEELPLKLLPNSVATPNASTLAENKMTETASRNAIADKELSPSKRPTLTPTVSSKLNTVMSKTSTNKRLELSTRPSKDSND